MLTHIVHVIKYSNLSIFFEYLTILSTDKAVFIYMNNMSLHFNDYEEKSEKI